MTGPAPFPTGTPDGIYITYPSLHYENQLIAESTAKFVHYVDCGFKLTTFREVGFYHCTFTRCYFVSAKFESVHFLDCTFDDCNFDHATFSVCTLDYSQFRDCSISYFQLRASLPTRLNLRRDLVRNLKVNAGVRGITEDARLFLLEELVAARADSWKQAFDLRDDYYRQFKWQDRVLGAWSWLGLSISGLLWGYGERPFRVVGVSATVIAAFAVFFWAFAKPSTASVSLSLWDGLTYSATDFVNSPIGGMLIVEGGTRIAAILEAYVGLILFGFLVAAIFRRISQR